MGHGDLLVTQLYLSRQATTAPYVPREASAAGRLRSNAETGQVKCIRGVPSAPLRRTWKQISSPKPVQEESAPLADGGISQIEADAVRRVFKNVEFRRNAGFAQRQIERHAVFGRHHGVCGAAEEKGGRRLW